MAVFEESYEIIIDNINIINKTISIAKDTIIKKDGIEVAKKRNRRSFVPGDIEAVKSYMEMTEGPEIDYLNAIWTEQVISDYLASLQSI